MKKIRLFAVAALLGGALLSSCAKEMQGEPATSGKRQLQAAIDGVTRASLDDVQIKWDEEDLLKVFYRTTEGEVATADFELIDGANSTSATFQEITSNMTDEDEILYVLYPAEGYWDYDGTGETEIPCALPARQSFDKLAMPMYGTSDDAAGVVSFSNCAAVFTLRLQGTGTITKVNLTSTSRYLAGGGAIDVSVPGEPKFRVENSSFQPYDTAASKTITFDCGTLTLGSEPVEIPIVVPILPGTASFGKSALAFEFYNGDDLVLTEKNTSTQQPVRNKKLLFPVWELAGAATGEAISILLSEAVGAGESELVLTAPIAGDQTIELPAGLPDGFQLSAPFADGTMTFRMAEGGAGLADAAKTLIVANMSANSTASFDFRLADNGIDVDFYGVAETLYSDVPRLTLKNKNTTNNWPIADVRNLVVNGGSVLNYYANEPETLTVNGGYVAWKSVPSVLTPAEGVHAYWSVDPYAGGSSLVLLWSSQPMVQGSGTAEDPYRIATVDDLIRVGWQFSKASTDLFAGQYFELTQDIDAGGAALERWGMCTSTSSAGPAFSGIFDGKGHTISNFVIKSGYYGVALFGFTRNATIKNLNVSKVSVEVPSSVGIYARWVGGLVGLMNGGSVIDCSVTEATLDRSGNKNHFRLGGLIGFIQEAPAENIITRCSVDGVTLRGWFTLGGLIGSVQSPQTTITDCSVKNVTIEHAYAESESAYASSPVVGDMGVVGNYKVDISNLQLGSWQISCTHPSASAAGWAAQKPTVWPYFGEIVDDAVITIDGEAATTRSLTESDMTSAGL